MLTRSLTVGLSPLLAAAVAFALSTGVGARSTGKKINIAHRGASAYAPEHTIHAYQLAMEQGADYVEQDLAVTKDGVLVSIHDLTLERTTDVEEVFPDRFVEVKEGTPAIKEGLSPGKHWLVNDFTLEEIERLDAGAWFDRKFAGSRIPTFQQAIDLVRTKPGTGIYPELKDPEFYRDRGISAEKLFADVLRKNNLLKDPTLPVVLQSFDAETLKLAAGDIPQVPRAYLVEPKDAALIESPDKLREIATWATGIAPHKSVVGKLPNLVADAHAAKLTVTLWTFRSSNTGKFPSVRAEMQHYLDLGVDELFTDNPDQFPR
jgi:glycerophosphoryl diester phosphodiesterase